MSPPSLVGRGLGGGDKNVKMTSINPTKLVLFGAGKIGRSFIGQLFSRAGYEVVFVDKDERLIDALNRQHSYKVLICDAHPETMVVNNVRGVHADDTATVVEEIASADILAVSIGKNGLPHIVPVLSKGLLKREKDSPGQALDIILAENMRNADVFLHGELAKVLPATYPLNERVGLVETSIGKMVPLAVDQSGGDILSVSAEAYNTLIVDKKGFKNPVPAVAGLEAKENMKAWVDRKLFIHNFGHAAVAYRSYLLHPEFVYTWEALEDETVRNFAGEAMRESATVLETVYPGVFADGHLQMHIDDLLHRFANRSLGDTIFRVGCDLYRKLSPDDRIITPLMSAFHHQLPYSHILQVLSAAIRFKCTGPDGKMFPSDVDFHRELEKEGKKKVLQRVCGFSDAESGYIMREIAYTVVK